MPVPMPWLLADTAALTSGQLLPWNPEISDTVSAPVESELPVSHSLCARLQDMAVWWEAVSMGRALGHCCMLEHTFNKFI